MSHTNIGAVNSTDTRAPRHLRSPRPAIPSSACTRPTASSTSTSRRRGSRSPAIGMMRPPRITLLHWDFAVSKGRAVAASHIRNKPITGKSYATSVDATHGPAHSSYVNRYGRSLKPLLVDRFCPLDEGLLSQSNLVTIQGGPLVGAFQFAVLTWPGFLLVAAAAAKVRAPRRFAMAIAGCRLAPSALPLAWSVSGVEVTVGTGLVSSWHPTFMLPLAPQSGPRSRPSTSAAW